MEEEKFTDKKENKKFIYENNPQFAWIEAAAFDIISD